MAAEVLATILHAPTGGELIFFSSHRETPSRRKQALVFATIFTGATPQVCKASMWNFHPAKPDNPTMTVNATDAEAKRLSHLAIRGSDRSLMRHYPFVEGS
jgi:hypothetical protein